MTADIEISASLNVARDKTITLDLNGHVLSLKEGSTGSVILVNGNFTLNDTVGTGKVTGGKNTSSVPNGGGVHVDKGVFNMYGGTIEGNTANHGGGVFVGGIIDDTVKKGTFNMYGGTIKSNSAEMTGGGVALMKDMGEFYMYGGTIISNSAKNYGGGVFAQSTITLGGDAKITGNTLSGGKTANNLHLYTGATVTIASGVYAPDNMLIGVTLQSGNGDVTSGHHEAARYFRSDNENYLVAQKSGNVVLTNLDSIVAINDDTKVGYNSVQSAIVDADPNANETIKMVKDSKEIITIEAKTITLDLNGKVLTGYNGSVITVAANTNLTLKDSNSSVKHDGYVDEKGLWHLGEIPDGASGCTEKTIIGGIITGDTGKINDNGSNIEGGGVYVSNGTFTMNGGTITGNTATNGGGVYVKGKTSTFNMFGGAISGNSVFSENIRVSVGGGGVFVSAGTFNMTGGKISDNSNTKDNGNGGGVYISKLAVFRMTGGSITGNKAGINGGVYGFSENMTVGGDAIITGNTNLSGDIDNNLYLATDKKVSVGTDEDAPDGMLIGVTLASGTGDVTGTNAKDYSGCFKSDNDSYIAVNGDDNKVQIMEPVAKIGEKKYGSVQDAVNASGSGDLITMLADSVISKILTVSDKTVTLDLNGHVLKRTDNDNDDGNAIDVLGGYLTLKDSNPSAEHTGEFASLPAGGVITGGKKYGGVWVNGVFSMESGTICGNTSNSGGGVYNIGTFNMTGGAISDNSALFGGGGVTNYGTFTMTGGIITENSSMYANGVYDEGTMTVGGTAKIIDNNVDNLYLVTGKTVSVKDGFNGEIGVTTAEVPVAGAPVDITGENSSDFSGYFTSDNTTSYTIVNGKGNKVQLSVPEEPKPIPTPGAAIGRVNVYVDDELLTEGVDYNWVNGKVVLTAEFVATLEAGEHVLTIEFPDNTVDEDFSIVDGIVVPIENAKYLAV